MKLIMAAEKVITYSVRIFTAQQSSPWAKASQPQGQGGARRSAKTARAKVSFRPRNNMPSLSAMVTRSFA